MSILHTLTHRFFIITECCSCFCIDGLVPNKRERRDIAQQTVERVVDQVGRFNWDKVPKFLRAYNAEMIEWAWTKQ